MSIAGPPLQNPVLIADLLGVGLATKPDELALVSTAARWTWRELDEASHRLASNLLALGLKPGDRVASLMPNRVVLIVHYLGCLRAGLVATPLNYRYTAPEIDHALAVSGAALLIAHGERSADIAESKLAKQLAHGVITYADDATDDDGADTAPGGAGFAALIDPATPLIDLPSPSSDAPALILFTSGSTGKPKGVTHTHGSLGYLVASTIFNFRLCADDILLPGISISHVAGIGYSLSALGAGARVDVARTYVDDELLQLLRHTRPTVIVMLPAYLFRLIRDDDARSDDFRSLRCCVVGGDKVTKVLEDEFMALAGLEITTNYGMTETGFATQCPAGAIRPGSIGMPNAGFTLSIRDDDGVDVLVGADGRLWIKTKSGMIGYWDNPDVTAQTIVDGWIDTGDVVRVDDDGYLWFAGRRKQIIVHDGSNISPQEVEEALQEHPAVADAGVVGVHDPIHGEDVLAYVTLKPDAPRPSDQTLIDFARARVGYKAPEEIVVLDAIPLNTMGKVDRMLLKQMAATAHEPGVNADYVRGRNWPRSR